LRFKISVGDGTAAKAALVAVPGGLLGAILGLATRAPLGLYY